MRRWVYLGLNTVCELCRKEVICRLLLKWCGGHLYALNYYFCIVLTFRVSHWKVTTGHSDPMPKYRNTRNQHFKVQSFAPHLSACCNGVFSQCSILSIIKFQTAEDSASISESRKDFLNTFRLKVCGMFTDCVSQLANKRERATTLIFTINANG